MSIHGAVRLEVLPDQGAEHRRNTVKLESTIELMNGEQPLIRIQGIEVFDDGSGAHGLLTVNSGHFSCTGFPFYFDNLATFCREVPLLYRELKGKTRISHVYEPDFVEFEVGKHGHVIVHGEICESGGEEQRLIFCFTIDQSYLPSLVASAESAKKEMDAANRTDEATGKMEN